jgi:hypothetical protein
VRIVSQRDAWLSETVSQRDPLTHPSRRSRNRMVERHVCLTHLTRAKTVRFTREARNVTPSAGTSSRKSARTPNNGAQSSLSSPSSPQIVPRLALSQTEAAEALGCSPDFLAEHVWPELRLVRRGRRTFVAIAELQRWLEQSAGRTLERDR